MTISNHSIYSPMLKLISALPIVLLVVLLPCESVSIGMTSLTRIAVLGLFVFVTTLLSFRPIFPFPASGQKIICFYVIITLWLFVTGLFNSVIGIENSSGFNILAVFTRITQPLLTLCTFFLLWYSRRATMLAWAFILIGIILSILNICQAFGLIPAFGVILDARTFGHIAMPFPRSSPINVFGTYGVLVLSSLGFIVSRLAFGLKSSLNLRLLLYTSIGINLLSIIITQDRSTYIGFFCLLIIFVFFQKKRVIKLIFFSSLLVIITLHGPSLIEKTVSMSPKTIENRLYSFNIAVDAFLSNPIMGIGWQLRAIVNEKGRVLHNSFLAILVYLGIAGFIPYITAYTLSFFIAIKKFKLVNNHEKWLFFGAILTMSGWFIENLFFLGQRGYSIWIIQGLVLYLATDIAKLENYYENQK